MMGDASEPRHILLIDDNPTMRAVFSSLAEALGWSAVIASGGERGQALAEVEAFDLIVTDQNMPDVEGLRLVAAIRTDSGPNRTTPVVLITSDLTAEVRRQSDRLGIEVALQKPVRIEDLQMVVDRLWPTACC